MKISKIMLTAVMAVGVSGLAAADQGSGKVTFTGSIVDAPCSIAPESLDQVVPLGAVSNAALNNGGKSLPREFNIQLEQCDFTNGKNKVKTTFTGVVSPLATGNELLAISGSATGAGVAIETYEGEKVELGAATSAATLTGTNPVLQYRAYLQGAQDSTANPITPGSFTAVANFELAYQ
ncbi:type 1 fimbria pilin [Acinetobacter calcoaceticus]|uniref:Type 1 fimbria pilin n=1 Tax=Acinetobacter calcoaceticus TaxID=471 RepID=A0A4R1XWU0_ACICA|nr:type 1 fimbria pilin [Acinetobacter calcoaceticus]